MIILWRDNYNENRLVWISYISAIADMIKKMLYIFCFIALFVFVILSGCRKEYSFEGRESNTDMDTATGGSPAGNWICPACAGNDAQIMSKWSFHSENILQCGTVDTALVAPGRVGFTFFGPYSCSADTGIIISAYLDGRKLDRDWFNIGTRNGAFYYYDNIGQTFAYISSSGDFTVVIDSYIHQTRIATGTFYGPVTKADGNTAFISSGKFKVKLE